jgi:hypothetical protein
LKALSVSPCLPLRNSLERYTNTKTQCNAASATPAFTSIGRIPRILPDAMRAGSAALRKKPCYQECRKRRRITTKVKPAIQRANKVEDGESLPSPERLTPPMRNGSKQRKIKKNSSSTHATICTAFQVLSLAAFRFCIFPLSQPTSLAALRRIVPEPEGRGLLLVCRQSSRILGFVEPP